MVLLKTKAHPVKRRGDFLAPVTPNINSIPLQPVATDPPHTPHPLHPALLLTQNSFPFPMG